MGVVENMRAKKFTFVERLLFDRAVIPNAGAAAGCISRRPLSRDNASLKAGTGSVQITA